MITEKFKITGIQVAPEDLQNKNKVFVNDIEVENDNHNENPNGFTWGYQGKNPDNLSRAILSMFIPMENRMTKPDHKIFETLVKTFTIDHVNGWGYSNFMVEINILHWLRQGGYTGAITFHHHISDKWKK